MKGVFVAILYIMIIVLMYLFSYNAKEKKIKITFFKIIFFSLIMTLFNYINNYLNPNLSYDRYNYYIEFIGIRKTSIGLTFIFNFVKNIGGNFDISCYLTTFLCTFIFFLSLKLIKDLKKETFIFLLITDVLFFPMFALKQCYTIMLSMLMFAIYFNSNLKFRHILCPFLIFLGCCFHTTGYILIPIYIILNVQSKKKIKIIPMILITIILLAFHKIVLLEIANSLINYIPSVSDKIYKYFNDSSANLVNLTFLKGIPFYFIAIICILDYKKIFKDYNNDKYFLLSFIGCSLYFLSLFSYWMFRFTLMFYLPIGIVFGIITNGSFNDKNRFFIKFIVYSTQLIILIRWIILMYINHGGF